MKRRSLLRTVGVIAASSLLAMTMQGAAFARGGAGHGGGFGGGGHAGFAGHGFGGGFAGRGFAGRGFAGRGGYGRFGNGRYGNGRYGYGRYGYGYGGWGLGAGLGLGLWLSVLPWDYETLWWDGLPYYYADNDYYTWDPQADGYQEVQPPPQVAQQAAAQAPAQIELFAYPKNGQSDQQQATDKAQCREWARGQSGYSTVGTAAGAAASTNGVADPPPNPQFAKRAEYLRAEAACLTGRGYSVR